MKWVPSRSGDVIQTQAWADGDAAHSSWQTADGCWCGFYHALLLLCLRHQVQNVMIAPLTWIPPLHFNQNKFGRHIFEDLECNNKYPNLSHLSHANGKYLIWKRECENKYLTCANKSQSSLTSVPESWAGSKTTISWRVSDSTPGAGSVFGTHEHPNLWSRLACQAPGLFSDINCCFYVVPCMFSDHMNVNVVNIQISWPSRLHNTTAFGERPLIQQFF